MKSISKTPVSFATARRIAADAFDGAELAVCEELTDGWFNAAYALTLADDRKAVLKVAPLPQVEVLTYERDILRAEVAALDLVRQHTEAPVPEVLWFDDSGNHVPSPLFVMSFVPGESLDKLRETLDPGLLDAVDAELGRHLRAINSIRGERFGLLSPSASRHATWRDAFTWLWSALLEDGERKDVVLPHSYDELRSAFVSAAPACDEITQPQFVYWDLWDGNVLVDPQTGELQGMLDLERALWGDPLMETQLAPYERRAAFVATYQPSALDTPSGQLRRAAYDLYLHLVMSIEGAYRLYPDDWIGDYARGQLTGDLERLRALS